MAALTLPEAIKRSRNLVFQGLAKGVVTTDEFAAKIPMVPCGDLAFSFHREASLPETAFLADSGASSEESTGKDDLVQVPLRRIVGNLDVDMLADDLTGDSAGSQRARQISMKAKATWEKVKTKVVNGSRVTSHTLYPAAANVASVGAIASTIVYGPWLDSLRKGPGAIKYVHSTTSWYFRAPGDVDYGDAVVAASGTPTVTLKSMNSAYWVRFVVTAATAVANFETQITFASTTNEFEGLEQIVDPAMVVDPTSANGDAFDLTMLNRMMSLEKVRTGRAFIMNSLMIERFMAELLTMNGAQPQMTTIPGFTGEVASYRGIPILCNDNILSDETVGSTTTCSSIYLASLDDAQGLCMPVAMKGGAINVDADPYNTPVWGFRISDLGERDGYDHTRTRVKWYGALALRSKLALVRRQGVQTA